MKELNELVAMIYEAAGGEVPWDNVTERCSKVFRADLALIARRNVSGDFEMAEWHGRSGDLLRGYEDQWIHEDPHVSLVRTAKPGDVILTQDVVNVGTYENSAYYREYLRLVDLYWSGYAVADTSKTSVSAICCHRERRGGPYQLAEVAELSMLSQHLMRAFRLARTMKIENSRSENYQNLIDNMQIGVFFISKKGLVLDANRTALRFIALNDGLIIYNRRLSATNTNDAYMITAMVEDVVRRSATRRDSQVLRPSGRHPWVISCTPVWPKVFDIAGGKVGAIVQVIEPDRRCLITEDRLQCIFGLTNAQARVACILCEGNSLVEIADQLRVSHETVRQHMKQIFAKVGCRRQTDLVRMLLALGP